MKACVGFLAAAGSGGCPPRALPLATLAVEALPAKLNEAAGAGAKVAFLLLDFWLGWGGGWGGFCRFYRTLKRNLDTLSSLHLNARQETHMLVANKSWNVTKRERKALATQKPGNTTKKHKIFHTERMVDMELESFLG